MALLLTRTVTFRAMHRYYRPEWSAEENQARFGFTSEEPGHSHQYQCAVTLEGPIDPSSSMIVDLVELDRILSEEVTVLDGAHLNEDVPHFGYGRTLPTCEALALFFYERILRRLPPALRLERVRVAEDATLHAEYTGPR